MRRSVAGQSILGPTFPPSHQLKLMLTLVASENADFGIAAGLNFRKPHFGTAATIG